MVSTNPDFCALFLFHLLTSGLPQTEAETRWAQHVARAEGDAKRAEIELVCVGEWVGRRVDGYE